MTRLLYVITFTSDIGRMKEFYRDRVGLRVASESPYWVSFDGDGGASLALMAIHPDQRREVELCFESGDVHSEVAALRGRGIEFADDVRAQPFGSVVHLRDAEGHLLSLLQPAAHDSASNKGGEGGTATATATAIGLGARVAAVILNVRDM